MKKGLKRSKWNNSDSESDHEAISQALQQRKSVTHKLRQISGISSSVDNGKLQKLESETDTVDTVTPKEAAPLSKFVAKSSNVFNIDTNLKRYVEEELSKQRGLKQSKTSSDNKIGVEKVSLNVPDDALIDASADESVTFLSSRKQAALLGKLHEVAVSKPPCPVNNKKHLPKRQSDIDNRVEQVLTQSNATYLSPEYLERPRKRDSIHFQDLEFERAMRTNAKNHHE